MAERAHPNYPGFRNKWEFSLRKGFVPWITVKRSPYREEFLWRYRWVNRYCQGRDVLDTPCGMGWGTSLLKGCNKLIGADISAEAIQEAYNRYGKHAMFLVGDMAKLEFKDRSFDIIVCLEGIEHVPQIVGEAFISETARVLRPGGVLLLSSPHCRTKEHSGNPYHIKEYKPEEMRRLIEPYFVIMDEIAREVDILTVTYISASLR